MRTASDGGVNQTRERWFYDLTIENKTFKELTNVDLKYVIFFKQEQLGVKAAATPRQQSGSFSIDDLKPHEKKSFSTNPVELNKSNLVGHWHYESGAKPNAQDTLVELAMRVYQGGQQFAEFANSLDAITGKAGLVCHPERKSRDLLLSPRVWGRVEIARDVSAALDMTERGQSRTHRIRWWDWRCTCIRAASNSPSSRILRRYYGKSWNRGRAGAPL